MFEFFDKDSLPQVSEGIKIAGYVRILPPNAKQPYKHIDWNVDDPNTEIWLNCYVDTMSVRGTDTFHLIFNIDKKECWGVTFHGTQVFDKIRISDWDDVIEALGDAEIV